jgi:hypothetical protein
MTKKKATRLHRPSPFRCRAWRDGYCPEQLSPRSRIELTRSVGFFAELLALALGDGSVVGVGDVDGLVDELLIELSIVPRTSTLWLTYFDRSSLGLALRRSPFAHELAIDDPVVPAVWLGLVVLVVGFVLVVPAVSLEPPADTLFRTKSPDPAVVVLGLAVVVGLVVPVVPAVLWSPRCKQPVTVTVWPFVLWLCELLLG